jgi:uncharacterized damage-inducible protein DinB
VAQVGRPAGKRTPAATGAAARGRASKPPVDLGDALVRAFLTNERINQVLLDFIDPRIWRESPPCSKRRNIATTFAHMHNVRVMRLKMAAKQVAVPARLDRAEVTMAEARTALASSAEALTRLIEHSLETGGTDPAALIGAAIHHEAHHRGQVCHWARELGAPITPEQQLKMWEWSKRAKEVRR